MHTQHAQAAMSHVVERWIVAALAFFGGAAAVVAGARSAQAQARAQQPAATITRESLASAISALRTSVDSSWIPAADRFSIGDSTIAAGRHATGPVAVANGTLHVRGTIDGDAVSYSGDIIVHQGGEIRGNANAILGKIILDGGTITGDSRTLSGDMRAIDISHGGVKRTAGSATMHAVALAGGWLAVLVIVGIGVLIFASPNLDAVSDALERSFGKSLLAGIATQLALAPALALLCIGLALTILGVLLIPFAVVAYILAAAGLVTLGYLAIARLVGRGVLGATERDAASRRAAALRCLVYGLLVLMVPWFVAGALTTFPKVELLARMVAVALTWVAASAGLGAAVVSRGGVKRLPAPAEQRALNTASWATPTPVSGVTAARRPTPFTTSAPK